MNKTLTIAKVSLPLPIDKLFDYFIPKRLAGKIKIGMRVSVLFNKKNLEGFVVGFSSKSKIKKLNPIICMVDKFSILTTTNLQLTKRIKDFYACSMGEAIETMLPHVLRKSKGISVDFSLKQHSIQKTKSKLIYIQSLSEDITFEYFKNEIIKRIRNKKRVIFLVPEIKMIRLVSEYFAKIDSIKIGIWHGRLSQNNILNLYKDLALDSIDLIIGTRSCIFAPIRNLDLIIIKDEDNYAYKDDQVPYYHAVKIAQMRSEIEKCDVILSSLIPSAHTYQLILNRKIASKVSKINKTLAEIHFTGINYRDKIDKFLEKEIEFALEKKEKILVFLNRRGFATFIHCINCKEIVKCSRCSSNLRFDYSKKKLICSYCNLET